MPDPARLLAESAAVGSGLLVLFFSVHVLAMRVWKDRSMTSHSLLAGQVFLSGFLFHSLFELAGWNSAFCQMRKEEE